MELGALLDAAAELLAVPSTADRPEQLARALDFTIGFVGAGFAVERFWGDFDGAPLTLDSRRLILLARKAITFT